MDAEIDLVCAQELCDLVAQDMGFVCSFMGEGGMIVASSARERIGQVARLIKQIAGQTAKATGDIGDPMSQVQGATQEVRSAAANITAIIAEVNAVIGAVADTMHGDGSDGREPR